MFTYLTRIGTVSVTVSESNQHAHLHVLQFYKHNKTGCKTAAYCIFHIALRSMTCIHSLPKECPWVEHLTCLPKGGWALFRLLPYLTMKEHPYHIYSNSRPSKQIPGHKITYSGITSIFEVESLQHKTLCCALH